LLEFVEKILKENFLFSVLDGSEFVFGGFSVSGQFLFVFSKIQCHIGLYNKFQI